MRYLSHVFGVVVACAGSSVGLAKSLISRLSVGIYIDGYERSSSYHASYELRSAARGYSRYGVKLGFGIV